MAGIVWEGTVTSAVDLDHPPCTCIVHDCAYDAAYIAYLTSMVVQSVLGQLIHAHRHSAASVHTPCS